MCAASFIFRSGIVVWSVACGCSFCVRPIRWRSDAPRCCVDRPQSPDRGDRPLSHTARRKCVRPLLYSGQVLWCGAWLVAVRFVSAPSVGVLTRHGAVWIGHSRRTVATGPYHTRLGGNVCGLFYIPVRYCGVERGLWLFVLCPPHPLAF